MRVFAKNNIKLVDNQVNKFDPPDDIYDNGFIPATSTQPGSPIVAQWFNSLFYSLTKAAPASGRGRKIPSPRQRMNTSNNVFWVLITTNDEGLAAITVGNTRTAVKGQIVAGNESITVESDGSFTAQRDIDWMLICAEMDGN